TDGDVRLLRAVGGWLSAHRPWLTATQPYADVGLLVGHPAPEVMQIPTLGQLWRASHRTLATVPSPAGELGGHPGLDIDLSLQHEGYDTERVGSLFAGRSWDLSAYRLVVVPETALLDEPTVQVIRAYVRQGGTLLACGHASLFDQQGQQRPDFALADVFGVTYVGSLPGYKQWDPLPDSGLVAGLPRNTGALTVTATTGTVLAAWRSAGGAPALVEQVYGQGRCLYASAEEAAFGPGRALLAELVARLIGPPPITLTSARSYARLVRRHGNDLLLYLLERGAGTHAASLGPESVGLTLDTRVLGPIIRAEVLPAGEPVALSRQAGAVRLWVNASPGVTALRLIRG
ncbi:MAG: beta-galactosidase trimerization domain-containing protein, partial [Candidatus Latescibacteria bacterium]|nr:beta-galactosidase trimerization domain-containing protein [Candidatus Latescibacterota bacterium]